MLGVFRIADRLQEIGISPDAAAIVGWAAALAVDATRNRQAACGVKYLFDSDLMLPAVTEIIFIDHCALGVRQHPVEVLLRPVAFHAGGVDAFQSGDG